MMPYSTVTTVPTEDMNLIFCQGDRKGGENKEKAETVNTTRAPTPRIYTNDCVLPWTTSTTPLRLPWTTSTTPLRLPQPNYNYLARMITLILIDSALTGCRDIIARQEVHNPRSRYRSRVSTWVMVDREFEGRLTVSLYFMAACTLSVMVVGQVVHSVGVSVLPVWRFERLISFTRSMYS